MPSRTTPSRLFSALLASACLAAPFASPARGQGNFTPPTPPKINMSTDPLLAPFAFRSIGPAVMMGRLDDIQGTEKDPYLLYIGFATGGLYKSTDMGNHWKSMFDTAENESIGAIGIAPVKPRHRLRRPRRSQQPPVLLHRRRHVEDHRRR